MGDTRFDTRVIRRETIKDYTLFSIHAASNYQRNLPTLREDHQAGANTTNLRTGSALPYSVIANVKPVYQDLVHPQELRKCLHGQTQNQNQNESLIRPSGNVPQKIVIVHSIN